jgi:hypothetical protein
MEAKQKTAARPKCQHESRGGFVFTVCQKCGATAMQQHRCIKCGKVYCEACTSLAGHRS